MKGTRPGKKKFTMVKRMVIPFSLIYFCLPTVKAQVLPPNSDSTVYAEFHNILKSNKPVQYIGTGPFSDNGTSQWLMFEGVVAPSYTIFRGRDANKDWMQRAHLAFVPAIRLRMFNEESFPVRPPNFNPYFDFHYLLSNLGPGIKKPNNFGYLQFQLAHLSNGQSGTFFEADSTTINLENGNFSTNYYKIGLIKAQYLPASKNILLDSALLSVSFLYRNDWSIDGSALVIDESLFDRYALQRVNFVFELRTKNITHGTYNYNKSKYKKQFSYLLRIDQEYRIGNVIESDGRDRRYSVDIMAAIYPANWRTFGFMAKYYYGRDNYNIRFNQKISFFQFGFTVDFDKFKPRNYEEAR